MLYPLFLQNEYSGKSLSVRSNITEWYEMNNTDVSIVRGCVYTVEDSANGRAEC